MRLSSRICDVLVNAVAPGTKRFKFVETQMGRSLAGSIVATKPKTIGVSMESALTRLGKLVEAQNGVDADGVDLLVQEGRRAIIEARKAPRAFLQTSNHVFQGRSSHGIYISGVEVM